MGDAAQRFSAVVDGAALFLRLAVPRFVGGHQPPSGDGRAGTGGARGQSDRWRDRWPKRRYHGKPGGVRGYDAGKKTKGRKRHIVTDTLGLLIRLLIHGADVQDRDGAPNVLKTIRHRFSPAPHHLFADGAYAGPKLRGALDKIGEWTLEIVKRSDTAKGFEVLPRRWVVGRHLRMAQALPQVWPRTGQKSVASAETWLLIAHIRLVTRRLATALLCRIEFWGADSQERDHFSK